MPRSARCRVSLVLTLTAALLVGLAPTRDARADNAGELAAAALRLRRSLSGINQVLNAAAAMRDIGSFDELYNELYRELAAEYQALLEDPATRAIVEGLKPLYKGTRQWSAYLAGTAEAPGYIGMGIGGEWTWDAPLCRFLGVGADNQVYRQSGASGVAVSGFATACLPLPFNTLELTYRYDRDVRPGLASRPALLPERYTAHTLGLDIDTFQWRRSDTLHLTFGTIDIDMVVAFQDSLGPDEQVFGDIRFTLFRMIRPKEGFLGRGKSLAVMDLDADTLTHQGLAASGVLLSPVRLEGYRLGGTGLYFDAAVGPLFGSFARDPNVAEETSPPTTIGADISVHGGTAARSVSVRFARTMAPTAERTLMLEQRLSAAIAWQRLTSVSTAELFVARAELTDVSGAAQTDIIGGASLQHSMALTSVLTLSLRGELGHSYYAVEDGVFGAPDWAYRGMAVVATQVGSQ